jgi:hypothetical protein
MKEQSNGIDYSMPPVSKGSSDFAGFVCARAPFVKVLGRHSFHSGGNGAGRLIREKMLKRL